MAIFSILTVCTGNVCRSPLAQQLLTVGLQERADVAVSSAGTGALIGQPMTEQGQALARRLGVEFPEQHSARALTIDQLRDADLVIAMSREHRRAIVEMLPRGARKTFTLRELGRLLTEVDEEDFDRARSLAPNDIGGRMRELVEIAASRRGAVIPPAAPEDDDVIDPYRSDDATYRESASQITPAVTLLLSQIERTIAAAH